MFSDRSKDTVVDWLGNYSYAIMAVASESFVTIGITFGFLVKRVLTSESCACQQRLQDGFLVSAYPIILRTYSGCMSANLFWNWNTQEEMVVLECTLSILVYIFHRNYGFSSFIQYKRECMPHLRWPVWPLRAAAIHRPRSGRGGLNLL